MCYADTDYKMVRESVWQSDISGWIKATTLHKDAKQENKNIAQYAVVCQALWKRLIEKYEKGYACRRTPDIVVSDHLIARIWVPSIKWTLLDRVKDAKDVEFKDILVTVERKQEDAGAQIDFTRKNRQVVLRDELIPFPTRDGHLRVNYVLCHDTARIDWGEMWVSIGSIWEQHIKGTGDAGSANGGAIYIQELQPERIKRPCYQDIKVDVPRAGGRHVGTTMTHPKHDRPSSAVTVEMDCPTIDYAFYQVILPDPD